MPSEGGDPTTLESLRDGLAIGGAEFVGRIREVGRAVGLGRETALKRSIRGQALIEGVIRAVEAVRDIAWDQQ